MSKPSPRPWHVDALKIDDTLIGTTIRHSIRGPFQPRAFESNQAAYDLDEANANHIVKCVNMHEEMLEALSGAMEYFDNGDEGMRADKFRLMIERCKSAIAKAKGGVA